MNLRYCLPVRWQNRLLVLLATACVAGAMFVPARAETPATDELKALGTSLNLVPEDAAFYSSMLRNREQVEAIRDSRAWAKLKAMPVVEMLRNKIEAESASPESPAGKFMMALENPQVQELLALLGDMFASDVFVQGDADMVGTMQLVQEIGSAMRYGPPLLEISGGMRQFNKDQLQTMLLMAVLAENVDRVKVPGMVLGFKVKDTTRAIVHLGKLEMILGIVLAQQSPELAEALQHTEIDGRDYLVLTLEGSTVPWDEIPLDKFKDMELQPGSVDKIVNKLKSEKLVIALGLHDDWLVVSVGSSTDPLAKLGKGPGLVSRPEMAPLARFADRRLASIGYASREFIEAANGTERQLNDLIDFVEQILPSLNLTEDQQKQIRNDAHEMAETLKQKMPVVGAASQVSFLSPQGVESYRYDWTTRPGLDGTKPLGLLSHVGGSPLLAVVARGKISIDDYDLAVSWLKRGYGYFRQYGLPNMDADDREEFDKVAELAGPILAGINETTREKFLPSLDGQIGLVIDARLTSKQFLATLPATDQPMPMAEPAILLGVRDADLMRDALVDYWNIIHEIWAAAAELNPELGEFPVAEPETVDTSDGEMFVFTPPEECPVDKQITPNVGLNHEVCVFSMSQTHAQRLLTATPLAAGGVLADTDRPLAAATVFHWSGLLRAGRPWVELAVDKILEKKLGPDAPEAQTQAIKSQVQTAVELLSVLRSITSESYFEDDVMVTHTLAEIRDLD